MRGRPIAPSFRRIVPIVAVFFLTRWPNRAYCQESTIEENKNPVQALVDLWRDWPQSENFRTTLEYRNYTYFEGEARGDSRDSINEGRIRIEYDNRFREDMRVYLNLLVQDDDADFTHGFFDLDEDELRRSYINFNEIFFDVYFDTFDLRLGKQIIKWGKADSVNPTDNLTPTDYSNLLDEDELGVPAANLNYYWDGWNLQLVGIPLFSPSRLPPEGTRFSIVPPDLTIPVKEPDLPPDTIDNAQFGARLKTTYKGWDFSLSYYDGINDIPIPELRYEETPIPAPVVVPVHNRMRVVGGDFATVFDRLGFHGEAAQFIFDGNRQDSYFEYVIGVDYTKADILFDHDIFIILEYVGINVTDKGTNLRTETPPLDRVLTSAIAAKIKYDFTDFTCVEFRGAIDFYQGNDLYVQPQLVHQVNDNLTIIFGVDLLGGPGDTFFGQFKDNDRFYTKLVCTF